MVKKSLADKLQKIIRDIERDKSVPLTRLTVLKKWLEVPSRVPKFAAFIAGRALALAVCTDKDSTLLAGDASAFFATFDATKPISEQTQLDAWKLRSRLYDYQKTFRNAAWSSVRIINNWNLYLVEASLDLLNRPFGLTTHGYKLAADYCGSYSPSVAYPLHKASIPKIEEIIRLVREIEAGEAAKT